MAWSVDVCVFDTDTAGLRIVGLPALDETRETGLGANGTYHVSLSSKPSNADVIIAIAADSSQLQVSPTTLIFTSGNWSAAQTVTVVALADSVPEGNHTVFIHHAIHSIDRAFSNLPVVRAPVSIFDYELQLNTTSLIVTEASSTAFTVNVGCGSFRTCLFLLPSSSWQGCRQ
jgi:hypothetical protein